MTALEVFLEKLQAGQDQRSALIAAAESVAAVPWDVVTQAGPLARCEIAIADKDLGLTWGLRAVSVDGKSAAIKVAEGQPYPRFAHAVRRTRGAFDTPIDMARRVVAASISAFGRTPPKSAIDPACGTGAFLVALAEAGVTGILGTDLDEDALLVARIACPTAKIEVGDAFRSGEMVDLVVGNPPFVPPERQDKAMRLELRRRFPWLEGRFDLVVPFVATALDRTRKDGVVGLVLPAPSMVQPYATPLRRRIVERHRVVDLAGPHPFPGASVQVNFLVVRIGDGPAPIPAFGLAPEELLSLDAVPLNPDLMPGDIPIARKIRAGSVTLGDLFLVDTGVVAHAPGGTREHLIHSEPGPGRVRYADAREFFAGEHRWLEYAPKKMHRAKKPEMFEQKKIVVQRVRGDGPIKAQIDETGTYVGHTCTVIVPIVDRPAIPLERVIDLLRSPLVDGLLRVERGERLDLYPRDVASIPVPKSWLRDPSGLPERAWGIGARDAAQLMRFARR